MRPHQEVLTAPYAPPDFQTFWERIAWSHTSVPLNIERTHKTLDDTSTHRVDRISFVGGGGKRIHGWFGVPKDEIPLFGGLLCLPVYGWEAQPIDFNSTLPGFATLSLNLHGYPPDYIRDYEYGDGYMARGIESRDSYIFRDITITALRALDVLAEQVEVDNNRLVAGGMSQGGGLVFWLSALTNRLKAVYADMPFYADHREYFRRQVRYPYKEIFDYIQTHPSTEVEIRQTLAYYDTLNFAPHTRCPVQVSYGKKDPKVRPIGVQSIYSALPEPKNLIVYENGHDWDPKMPENNLAWLKKIY